MAAKTVKCSGCNVVINEVLSFICNKIDVMNEQSISQICASAFDETEILAAKNLLYESISTTKRKKIRKRQGKTLRDIDDIICLLKETDPEDIPIFVARDLHKLPPVLFDHVDVTRILKDLLTMRCELDRFCTEYTTVTRFKELQLEVEALKHASLVNDSGQNVTMKRGGSARLSSFECESGPSALLPQEIEKIDISEGNVTKTLRKNSVRRPLDSEAVSHEASLLIVTAERKSNESPAATPMHSQAPPQRPVAGVSHPTPPPAPVGTAVRHTNIPKKQSSCQTGDKSFSNVLQEGEWKLQKPDEEWTLVQRQRLRNRFVGKTGTATVDVDTKFKAADNKIPLYIYNVSTDTSMSDIVTYIKNKINLDIHLVKMNMKTAKGYAAYKVFVPKHRLNTFLTDEFWPDGVLYRRFVDFRQNMSRNVYRDMVIPLKEK